MKARRKEMAKFACGFESFHALFYRYLWVSKTGFTVLGYVISPPLSAAALTISTTIAVSLGAYARHRPIEEFS